MCRFEGVHAEYKGQGFDELLMVIDKINKRLDNALVILSVCDPSDPKVGECPPGYTFAKVRLQMCSDIYPVPCYMYTII